MRRGDGGSGSSKRIVVTSTRGLTIERSVSGVMRRGLGRTGMGHGDL